MKKLMIAAASALYLFLGTAVAQEINNTVVTISGSGEVVAENDQAKATFSVEEQDKDKGAAASRVNQKMKDGSEALKKLDPDAKFATRGYYTYPVYSESSNKSRVVTGWRVGQYLDMTTKNLVQLPATVAAVQQTLSLNGIQFGLSEESIKNLEAKRIAAAYKDFEDRLRMLAKSMGRDPAKVVIESLDVDSSGNHFQPQPRAFAPAGLMMAKGNAVQETSFEPGETTLTCNIAGKVRFP